MSTKIIFLGLNRISLSLGLAMKKSGDLVERIGYDPDLAVQKMAVKMGAVDKIRDGLNQALKDADAILYALPASQLGEVLNLIKAECKAGCIVVNLEPIGHETFTMARAKLTDPRTFITWIPAVDPSHLDDNGLDPSTASQGLLANCHVYIAATPDTRSEAIQLGSDLAALAGALPLHIEPDELAGILALCLDYPRLVSLIMTRIVTNDPGWNEARKLAGYEFQSSSASILTYESDPAPQVSLHANRVNIQRLLDLTIENLQEIRSALDVENDQDLAATVNNTLLARKLWVKQRTEMSWLEKHPVNPDSPHSITEMMFGKPKRKS